MDLSIGDLDFLPWFFRSSSLVLDCASSLAPVYQPGIREQVNPFSSWCISPCSLLFYFPLSTFHGEEPSDLALQHGYQNSWATLVLQWVYYLCWQLPLSFNSIRPSNGRVNF